MCAVCWTGSQIIPASVVAVRYVWINHFGGRNAADEDEPEQELDELEVLDEPINA
jgi:hypothetical protein